MSHRSDDEHRLRRLKHKRDLLAAGLLASAAMAIAIGHPSGLLILAQIVAIMVLFKTTVRISLLAPAKPRAVKPAALDLPEIQFKEVDIWGRQFHCFQHPDLAVDGVLPMLDVDGNCPRCVDQARRERLLSQHGRVRPPDPGWEYVAGGAVLQPGLVVPLPERRIQVIPLAPKTPKVPASGLPEATRGRMGRAVLAAKGGDPFGALTLIRVALRETELYHGMTGADWAMVDRLLEAYNVAEARARRVQAIRDAQAAAQPRVIEDVVVDEAVWGPGQVVRRGQDGTPSVVFPNSSHGSTAMDGGGGGGGGSSQNHVAACIYGGRDHPEVTCYGRRL
jgi:hypothetical protein